MPGEMHVWDAQGTGVVHFDSAEIGLAELGYIIENRVIQSALIEMLASLPDVRTIFPGELAGIDYRDGHALVQLADGRSLSTQLIVGADGSNSSVRRLGNISTHGWPYDQRAIVTTVQPEFSHRYTAWQRFLPTGPLAFLPLMDEQCSIVWSTSSQHATALIELDESNFSAELEQAFELKLGHIRITGPRASFPLQLQHADQYIGQRLALIGDAAHTIHPLAGQGVNLGLLDAAALAEVLCNAKHVNRDLGGQPTLRKYERWRKGDNLMMMAAMDGFKRLFSNNIAPLCLLRNLGLTLTNDIKPIKNVLMRHAVGYRDDLPELAAIMAHD